MWEGQGELLPPREAHQPGLVRGGQNVPLAEALRFVTAGHSLLHPSGHGDLSDKPRYVQWGVLLEAGDGERLGAAVSGREELALLPPARRPAGGGIGVSWLLGWFENFAPAARQPDLGAPGMPSGASDVTAHEGGERP